KEAEHIAKYSFIIDEFIALEIDRGHRHPNQFTKETRHVKLHGHCYQKAFHLQSHTAKALSLPVNYSVEVIPSECCGMAGSFGYGSERYDLSVKVAEVVLLPAVRAAPQETLIAAPGTSCRHQIKAAVGRTSFHPGEILYNA